ncbi:hypothetical protein [Hyphomicrobium sp.]|jgi:hypothetical protein|uniref:hypothetical protein n=1 Tax=Hyphomicrobium sp. TaxID=82 RepID=UPI0035673DC7
MLEFGSTSSRYSISRSVNERDRHLIFEEGGFDELPESIRRQTPWQYLKSGQFKNLRPDYLKALVDRGYIIVEQSAGVFSAET